MAALTPTLVKVETEGDLQVVYLKFSSIINTYTYDASLFFKNVVGITYSSQSEIGITESAGVITFTTSSGTPSAFVRICGN